MAGIILLLTRRVILSTEWLYEQCGTDIGEAAMVSDVPFADDFVRRPGDRVVIDPIFEGAIAEVLRL